MEVSFGHHISLSYRGGGEKWLTQFANELVRRGHEITIRALPVWKRDNPIDLLPEIDYKEGYFHRLEGDVVYITYNPLSGINFKTTSPKIGGIHSHCYWQPFAWKYGLLPNLANFVHMITKRWELEKFDALHTVTPIYPLNVEKHYYIPNFVDSNFYKPCAKKHEEFTVGYASRKLWSKGHDLFQLLKAKLNGVNFVETDNTPESEMPDFYARNHVTVVPARVDTFGLVNVESMLCGTPVISSGLQTHRALGLPMFYAETLNDYLDNIRFCEEIHDTDLYQKLIQEGRESALRFDKKVIVNQLEQMLYDVSESQ